MVICFNAPICVLIGFVMGIAFMFALVGIVLVIAGGRYDA